MVSSAAVDARVGGCLGHLFSEEMRDRPSLALSLRPISYQINRQQHEFCYGNRNFESIGQNGRVMLRKKRLHHSGPNQHHCQPGDQYQPFTD